MRRSPLMFLECAFQDWENVAIKIIYAPDDDIEAEIAVTKENIMEIPEEHWCIYEQLFAEFMGWVQ